jgi:S-DNA-T family DNA segregation ATPase FtsK/SpoIIIE
MAQEISVTIGVDSEGNEFVFSLTQSPHALFAGTTGSGKSTLIHNILCSLIENHDDDKVRIFIGDPKRVEFYRYAGTPHVERVARDVIEHEKMLRKLVFIMNTRYQIMENCMDENGLPVVSAYNQTMYRKDEDGIKSFSLPNIIVVIDELGNLVLDKQSGKNILDSIIQLVQLGRAAGITVLLATQQPTAKIIDTRIKANCPTRIALKVTSRVNSRVVIDSSGAETLNGYGDALVLLPTSSNKIRVQCLGMDYKNIADVIEKSVQKKLAKNTFNNQNATEAVKPQCKVIDLASLKSFRDSSVGKSSGSKYISPN